MGSVSAFFSSLAEKQPQCVLYDEVKLVCTDAADGSHHLFTSTSYQGEFQEELEPEGSNDHVRAMDMQQAQTAPGLLKYKIYYAISVKCFSADCDAFHCVDADELEELQSANVIYTPAAVVVNRCDKTTGCCHSVAETCSSVPELEQQVHFTVQVTTLQHRSRHATGVPFLRTRKRKISLKDHTVCVCLPDGDGK